MKTIPEIIPVTDLRQDAAAALKKVRDTHDHIIITQRGRAAAVLVNVEEFERLSSEHRLLTILAKGEQEIREGEGFSLEEVLTEADAKISEKST